MRQKPPLPRKQGTVCRQVCATAHVVRGKLLGAGLFCHFVDLGPELRSSGLCTSLQNYALNHLPILFGLQILKLEYILYGIGSTRRTPQKVPSGLASHGHLEMFPAPPELSVWLVLLCGSKCSCSQGYEF